MFLDFIFEYIFKEIHATQRKKKVLIRTLLVSLNPRQCSWPSYKSSKMRIYTRNTDRL